MDSADIRHLRPICPQPIWTGNESVIRTHSGSGSKSAHQGCRPAVVADMRRISETLAAETFSSRAVSRTPRPSSSAARMRSILNDFRPSQAPSTSPRRHPVRIINHVAAMAGCQTFSCRAFDSAMPSCRVLVID